MNSQTKALQDILSAQGIFDVKFAGFRGIFWVYEIPRVTTGTTLSRCKGYGIVYK